MLRNAIPTDGQGTGTANYILIRHSEQVSIPLYRFTLFLEHEKRCGGCTNKNYFNFCQLHAPKSASDRRSGTGTANYILIRLSEQVSIPLYRFIHFLEHEMRCGGCANKNYFNFCQLHAPKRVSDRRYRELH